MSQHVYVLGGGPCGLALAYELSQHKIPVTVIEASDQLGGLAKTISWGQSTMDYGPHKLFTLNEELMNKVLQLRPSAMWLEHSKTSRIYMNGHYLSYPPSPLDLWKTFGTVAFLHSCWDMLLAKIHGVMGGGRFGAATFENDARARVGDTLYGLFFKPLANKIWGDPIRLDETLSKSRIQVPSVRALIRNLFQRGKKSTWQANTYRYPKGGLSTLWTVMEKSIRDQGGEIILNDPVASLDTDALQRIQTLKLQSGKTFSLNPEQDWVFSTLPFARLGRMITPAVPKDIVQLTEELQLNDLWLIFMKVEGDVLKGNAWIFAPDNSVVFHRVSTQRKFDPGMVEGNLDLICCEIMNYPGKPTATMSEAEIIQACIKGLQDMKLIDSAKVVKETRIVKLPRSYPVMTVGYQKTQTEMLEYFDRYTNLRTIGRQGAYNYIGTLDAMDTGFGAARWLLERSKGKADWQAERKRTMFYPILD